MQPWLVRFTFGCIAVPGLVACGFVYDEPIVGPYRLVAVDVLEDMRLCRTLERERDCIGRISETVFSVGWNARYVVAKQHPQNDRSITNYYYLERTKDTIHANRNESVTGPLSFEEFDARTKSLGLPSFSLTVESLK